MRRTCVAAVAGLAVIAFAAGAASQPPTAPAVKTAGPPPLDQLSDPACGAPRNAGDDYWAAPLYPDQARAPRISDKQAFKVEVVTQRIDRPWGMVFLPNGKMLVTIRAGAVRLVDRAGTVSEPLAGVPAINPARLSAMYDIALDRDFARNRTLYLGLVTRQGETGTTPVGRIVRAKLSADERGLEDVKVIFEGTLVPRRIVQARDGTLIVTSGEVASGGPNPQSLKHQMGKVLRINADGSIPRDNPFVNNPEADPALYAVGFRDTMAAAFHPTTGELWVVENEPMGGDELNLIRPGANYGFPVISYGRENNGALINGGKTRQDGMEQPVYFWTPSIAPSGMVFYTGDKLPGWKDSLFVGAMSGMQLVRLEMRNGRVVGEEKLLRDRCRRIKDVRQSPDGFLYVITDDANAQILRLAPA